VRGLRKQEMACPDYDHLIFFVPALPGQTLGSGDGRLAGQARLLDRLLGSGQGWQGLPATARGDPRLASLLAGG